MNSEKYIGLDVHQASIRVECGMLRLRKRAEPSALQSSHALPPARS